MMNPNQPYNRRSLPQQTKNVGRTNSMTSLQSFTSANKEVSHHRNFQQRSHSTTDLFQFDDVLAKKKLKKNRGSVSGPGTYRPHHSMVAEVNPYTTKSQQQEYIQQNRFGSQVAQTTRHPSLRSFVPIDNYSFILPTKTPTQQELHRIMNTNTNPMPSQMNFQANTQQQNPILTRQQYHEKIRSSPNYLQYRPKQERLKQNVPFTFPNGEIYIPRSKQGSYTNLPQLANDDTSVSNMLSPPPPMTALSSTSSNLEECISIGPVLSLSNHRNSPQSTDSSIHPGSSNSPSCTESSNEVAGENTPPSSIDDFILHNNINNTLAGPGKIEPISRNSMLCEVVSGLEEVNAASNTVPEGGFISIDSAVDDLIIPERSSKRPVPSSPAIGSIGSPTKKRALNNMQSSTSIAKSVSSSFISTNSCKDGPASKDLTKKGDISVKTKPERKPSLVRRLFNKLGFSNDKSKNKPSSSISSLGSSFIKKSFSTTHLHHQSSTKTISQGSHLQKVPEPETEREQSVYDDVDNLSFIGTKEEINVHNNYLKNSDFDNADELIDDFSTETILNSMFDSLNISQMAHVPNCKPVELIHPVVGEIKTPISSNTALLDDEDEKMMDFEDLEYIEKIIEFGDTSFPNLKLEDFGKNERKLLKRSKSIERRKPSSLSTPPSIFSVVKNDSDENCLPNVNFVFINELKSPPVNGTVYPLKSSLSTRCSSSTDIVSNGAQTLPKRAKSVCFSSKVYLQATHPSTIYNRKSQRDNTNYIITPSLIQNVRMEINEFKKDMLVHSMSAGNTHFFKA